MFTRGGPPSSPQLLTVTISGGASRRSFFQLNAPANQLLLALVLAAPAMDGVGQQATPSELSERAIQLEQDGHPAAALDTYEAALQRDPGDTVARAAEVRLGTSLALKDREAGDMEGALALLQRARNFVPDDPALLLAIGLQQSGMHLQKAAETTLAAAHAAHPRDPDLTYGLARVELERQKLPEAEKLFREYLNARPNDASAHYGLGRLLHMAQRNQEAVVELERCIELQPVQTEAYYELGQIMLEEGRDDEARSRFERVLARSSTHGGALTGMGILAYRAKDYTAAERYLNQAEANAYTYQPAHYYYGLPLARLGKQEESRHELALATEMAEGQHAAPKAAGQTP